MKELRLENDKLKIGVLPELGGKVRSFFLKERDFEIAAQPGRGKSYRRAESEGNFGDYDMSGLDDAFPNIDAEILTYGGRVLPYPDHGEIWSHEMEVLKEESGELVLQWFSPRFSYRYRKTLSLSGNALRFSYEIENEGDTEFPCIWTMHGLLRLEEDMRLFYPEELEHVVNVLPDTPLGEMGKEFPLSSAEHDFSRLPSSTLCAPYYMKYYGVEKVREGSCGVFYPSFGVRVSFSYDGEALPWLGVWINGGGFSGDYNLALEMTNGFYDKVSTALENHKLRLLKPGERLAFAVALSAEAEEES